MAITRRDLIHRAGQASGGGLLYLSASGAAADSISVAGPSAAPTEELVRQFSGIALNARQFGAKGDGATDDTAALQSAIDTAFRAGINLFIPAGIYRTAAALTVGTPSGQGPNHSGWRIFGAGPGQYGGPGGTEIKYSGGVGTALAVLQVNSSAWRTCLIEEMTLVCDVPGGAQYGICFKSTEFSQHTVRRIAIINAGIATAILAPSGGNGEFTLFEDCCFTDVDGWYYTNASQAFIPLFHHCRGSVRSGGIYFNLDLGGTGAGGLEVFDCNATSVQTQGVSNSLLFRNGGSDSVGIFMGGRIEHLTQLYVNEGGSPNLGMPLKIIGMEIGIDFDPSNRFLARDKRAVISTGGNTDTASVESCRFFGDSERAVFPIEWGSWSDLRFKSCIFNFRSGPPRIISSLYNERSSLSFEDCKVSTITSDQSYRPNAFDRHMDNGQSTVGKYRAYSENAWVASGRPENLLVKPQIATSSGKSIVPDAPWKITGSGSAIGASDWTAGSDRPKSSSPFAKKVAIPPATSLYQDIAALNLSSGGNYGYDGQHATLVSYQSLVTCLGPASGRVELVDSVSGQIYDQYVFARGGPQRHTQLITLSAAINRTGAVSFPRLTIANTSQSETLTFEFAWQFVSSQPNPAFADSTGGAASYAGEWGAVVESFLAFSRVALPHKSDAFGATAANPLNDLASNIYLSATDERLTYHADRRWWKIPRSRPGTAPPTSGAWAQGDKIENSQPTELGDAGGKYVIVGWICVAAGSPGTWLPMRMLTGG